jgi:molybdopterin converting factor small subunit
MTLHILSFGPATDHCPNTVLQLAEGATTQELRAHLEDTFPGLKQLPFVLSVNRVIRHDVFLLQDGDEVALLPPFSGG